jgi:hypothetical protein
MNSETMQNKLITEMNNVLKALESFNSFCEKDLKTHDFSEIKSAIIKVSSLAREFEKRKPELNRRDICQSICDLAYKVNIQFPKCDLPKDENDFSVFKSINKDRNENLHSDCIAALLNPNETGRFAEDLFVELIEFAGGDLESIKKDFEFQIVQREVTLHTIDESLIGCREGDRRIDLLVKTNSRVLVIENKVQSYESENQTSDYYHAVLEGFKNKKYRKEDLFFLFLSPTGMPASCRHFRAISYVDLYKLMTGIKGNLASFLGSRLYEFYIGELAKTIISPMIRSNEFTGNFLKGRGYGSGQKIQ